MQCIYMVLAIPTRAPFCTAPYCTLCMPFARCLVPCLRRVGPDVLVHQICMRKVGQDVLVHHIRLLGNVPAENKDYTRGGQLGNVQICALFALGSQPATAPLSDWYHFCFKLKLAL
jgi:hypothetical protein